MFSTPRMHFAQLPTPVEEMARLSAMLEGPHLMVKRDDLTGLAMGGNKTRKLEFLLAEAQSNGARLLITAGASQSNHCRQTAAAAARFGYECTLVLTLPANYPVDAPDRQPATANILLDRLFGAEIIWTTREKRDQVLQEVFQSALAAGKNPHLIPYGGSSPAGITSYVFALQELLEQGIRPDWIVFPSSSGGTQAGLVLGADIFGFEGKILGISVDETEHELKKRVASLATDTANFLGENRSFTEKEILVNSTYLGGGYGIMGRPEHDAIHEFARAEGLLVDPVYTGRAAAGLMDLIRRGMFDPNDLVLFWHTGGTPALFADRYQSIAQDN
jgi:D-cysteine desulfhydrase family pyridoxal phosphate-dependent enzyme